MASWREKFTWNRKKNLCAVCKQHKPIFLEGWRYCHDCWLAQFPCLRCGVNTRLIDEYYNLKNKVWLTANPRDEGMLCIGCVEHNLGRTLTREDFSDAPINDLDDPDWPKSERLINRLSTFTIIKLTVFDKVV